MGKMGIRIGTLVSEFMETFKPDDLGPSRRHNAVLCLSRRLGHSILFLTLL